MNSNQAKITCIKKGCNRECSFFDRNKKYLNEKNALRDNEIISGYNFSKGENVSLS